MIATPIDYVIRDFYTLSEGRGVNSEIVSIKWYHVKKNRTEDLLIGQSKRFMSCRTRKLCEAIDFWKAVRNLLFSISKRNAFSNTVRNSKFIFNILDLKL